MKNLLFVYCLLVLGTASFVFGCTCDRVNDTICVGSVNLDEDHEDLSCLRGIQILDGSLTVQGTGLSTLSFLEDLTIVTGDISIASNVNLANLSAFVNLTTIEGELDIYSNPALLNIDGLSNLRMVYKAVYFDSNFFLQNLNGFQNLRYIGGFLRIQNMRNVTDISGLSNLLRVGGYVTIFNVGITSIGLNNLRMIGGDFSISLAANLRNLDGLYKLRNVTGYVDIDTPALESLSGLCSIFNEGPADLPRIINDTTCRPSALPLYIQPGCDCPTTLLADMYPTYHNVYEGDAINLTITLFNTNAFLPVDAKITFNLPYANILSFALLDEELEVGEERVLFNHTMNSFTLYYLGANISQTSFVVPVTVAANACEILQQHNESFVTDVCAGPQPDANDTIANQCGVICLQGIVESVHGTDNMQKREIIFATALTDDPSNRQTYNTSRPTLLKVIGSTSISSSTVDNGDGGSDDSSLLTCTAFYSYFSFILVLLFLH